LAVLYTVEGLPGELPRVNGTRYRSGLSLAQEIEHQCAILDSLETVRAAAHETLELPTVSRPREECHLAFQISHRHAMLGVEKDDRAHLEANREGVILPDSASVLARANDFEGSHPPHDASEVAEENVPGLYSPSWRA